MVEPLLPAVSPEPPEPPEPLPVVPMLPEPYEEPDPAVPLPVVPVEPVPPYVEPEPVVPLPDPGAPVSEPEPVDVEPVLPEDWAKAKGAAPSIPMRTIFFMNPFIVSLSRGGGPRLGPDRPRSRRGLGWMPCVTTGLRDKPWSGARAAGEQPVGPPRIPGSGAEWRRHPCASFTRTTTSSRFRPATGSPWGNTG